MQRKNAEICYSLLAIICIGALFLSGQQFFLLAVLFFGVIILRDHFLLVIPKVPGIRSYIIAIVISLLLGLFVNDIRSIIRDLYYILPSLLWLFIGYTCTIKQGSIDIILKSMFLYASIISIKCSLDFLLQMNFSFGVMRGIFGFKVYDVGIICPVFMAEVLFFKKTIFGKKIDIFFLLAMLLQIMLSFGRAAILAFFIELLVIVFTISYLYNGKLVYVKRLCSVALFLIILTVILFKVMPSNVLTEFIEKLSGGFQEIELGNEIDSVPMAMNNWRAYEMQSALSQWRNSNLIAQIFGRGLGTGTYIEFVPYSWSQMVVNNRIPILHNGFLTLLNKGGLFLSLSLLWMFLGPFLMSFKKVLKRSEVSNYAIFLMAIAISGIVITYVVRGPVVQGEFLAWSVLTACFCAENSILKQRR